MFIYDIEQNPKILGKEQLVVKTFINNTYSNMCLIFNYISLDGYYISIIYD